MKLAALIRETEKRLRAARLHFGHGTDNPRDEAAFIVLRGLGLAFDAPRDAEVAPEAVEKLVAARIRTRKPAAYLLREAWLDGVPFYVDERVIVPRSHIAFLLGRLAAPKQALDLCTGSGCLAILAARAFPRAAITASDVSPGALAVARKNVARHALGHRVEVVRSDLFAGLRKRRFDLVVSNPPYVDAAAMKKLPAEYRREPALALAAGPDGLDIVRRILGDAKAHLTRGGVLLCEVGDSRRALERAYPALPFEWPHEAVFMLRREGMG